MSSTSLVQTTRSSFAHALSLCPLLVLLLLCALPACSTAVRAGSHDAAAESGARAHPDKTKFIKPNFEQMPIPLLAKVFADLTRTHYILRGVGAERIDLKLDHRVTVEEAQRLFLAEVERRGYVVRREGKTIRITDPRLPAPQHAPTPK